MRTIAEIQAKVEARGLVWCEPCHSTGRVYRDGKMTGDYCTCSRGVERKSQDDAYKSADAAYIRRMDRLYRNA